MRLPTCDVTISHSRVAAWEGRGGEERKGVKGGKEREGGRGEEGSEGRERER